MNKDERIKGIVKALEKIAKGDFDFFCPLKNPSQPDEIDVLAIGINMMISDLKERTEKTRGLTVALEEAKTVLEIKVEARTKELKGLTEQQEEIIKERTEELQEKINELQKFQKLTVGRELKMIEFKREIKRLKNQLKSSELNKKE